jgi:hypothetical protein
MEPVKRYLAMHPAVMRVASILVLLALAACNNGSDGNNPGGGGY